MLYSSYNVTLYAAVNFWYGGIRKDWADMLTKEHVTSRVARTLRL